MVSNRPETTATAVLLQGVAAMLYRVRKSPKVRPRRAIGGFKDFWFPGRWLCQIYPSPSLQILGEAQIPKDASPEFVFYSDGWKIYEVLFHPWPGREEFIEPLPRGLSLLEDKNLDIKPREFLYGIRFPTSGIVWFSRIATQHPRLQRI